MEAWKLELYYGTPELYHYGTKGMHWGTRHWQNDDGTFNEAGKQRYFSKGSGENYKSVVKSKKQAYKKAYKDYSKSVDALGRKQYSLSKKKRAEANEYAGEVYKKAQKAEKARQEYKEAKNANKKQLTPEQKQKITKAAVGALAAAAVVGGTVYLAKTGKLNSVADAGKKLINKGKDAAEKAISKGKNLTIAGKFAAKSMAETISRKADYASWKIGDTINNASNSIKLNADIAKDKIKNSKAVIKTQNQVEKAINKGKNSIDRLVDKATYKKRLREAEANDAAEERRQEKLKKYAAESLKAFQDPHVLSYTRNDPDAGYYEHWEKKR